MPRTIIKSGAHLRMVVWLLWTLGATSGCGPAADGRAAGERGQAIVGGVPAAGSQPAVVALVRERNFELEVVCSGVLIAADAVLTAAHCADGDATLRVFVGDDVGGVGSNLAVDRRVVHPDWSPDAAPAGLGQPNDIAVLTLSSAIATVTPLALIDPSEAQVPIEPGAPVQLVGFGETAPGVGAGVKRTASARVAQVGPYELRVGLAAEPQGCSGDSGGPALVDIAPVGATPQLRVAGVATRALGVSCTDGVIYTRADAYASFVAGAAGAGCGGQGCPGGGTPSNAGPSGLPSGDPQGAPRASYSDGGCALGAAPACSALSGGLAALALLGLALFGRRRPGC